MAFRADEATRNGYERAQRYLVPRHAEGDQKTLSQHMVRDIADKCGPVIDSYPAWHPLVSANEEKYSPVTTPGTDCGYQGLDHTVYFANGFVTCPYGNGQQVMESVERLPFNSVATITAERLDVQLYSPDATPILVYCNWERPLTNEGMIPKSLVVPLILEQEVPCWRSAVVAETWETMRPYFLGTPYGSRSSLFVNQETGQVIKNIWIALINTGMFGPIRV